MVAYTCTPERKQTKCLSKGVYFLNVLAKCHWRPYYEIQVLYHDTLPCAALKKIINACKGNNISFCKASYQSTIRVSNSLAPVHSSGPTFAGPDLGLNCCDDTNR